MNRAAVIEQLKATRESLDKLLALVESSEADRFAAHIYQCRREYRHREKETAPVIHQISGWCYHRCSEAALS
jgi:hypothetical protein